MGAAAQARPNLRQPKSPSSLTDPTPSSFEFVLQFSLWSVYTILHLLCVALGSDLHAHYVPPLTSSRLVNMSSNGSVPGSSGYQDLTALYNKAQSRPTNRIKLQETEKQKAVKFKASHALLVGFFVWIGWVRIYMMKSCVADCSKHHPCPGHPALHQGLSPYTFGTRFAVGMQRTSLRRTGHTGQGRVRRMLASQNFR